MQGEIGEDHNDNLGRKEGKEVSSEMSLQLFAERHMVVEGAQVQHAGERLEPILMSQVGEVLQGEGEQVEGWGCCMEEGKNLPGLHRGEVANRSFLHKSNDSPTAVEA